MGGGRVRGGREESNDVDLQLAAALSFFRHLLLPKGTSQRQEAIHRRGKGGEERARGPGAERTKEGRGWRRRDRGKGGGAGWGEAEGGGDAEVAEEGGRPGVAACPRVL